MKNTNQTIYPIKPSPHFRTIANQPSRTHKFEQLHISTNYGRETPNWFANFKCYHLWCGNLRVQISSHAETSVPNMLHFLHISPVLKGTDCIRKSKWIANVAKAMSTQEHDIPLVQRIRARPSARRLLNAQMQNSVPNQRGTLKPKDLMDPTNSNQAAHHALDRPRCVKGKAS